MLDEAGKRVLLNATAGAHNLDAVRFLAHSVGAGQGLVGINLAKWDILVQELMINAIVHGGGTAYVNVWRPPDRPALFCSVADCGPGIPQWVVDGQHRAPGERRVPMWGMRVARLLSMDPPRIVSTPTGS